MKIKKEFILIIVAFVYNNVAWCVPDMYFTLRVPLAFSVKRGRDNIETESLTENKKRLYSLIEKSRVLNIFDKSIHAKNILAKPQENLPLFDDRGEVIELNGKDLDTIIVYHRLPVGLVPFVAHFGFFNEAKWPTLTTEIESAVYVTTSGNVILAFHVPKEKVQSFQGPMMALSGYTVTPLHENFLSTLEFYFGNYSPPYQRIIDLLKLKAKFVVWGRLEPELIDWEESLRATLIFNLFKVDRSGIPIEEITKFSLQCKEYFDELRNFDIIEQSKFDRNRATEISL